jgi:cell wall-associated NlpC family hydrolase
MILIMHNKNLSRVIGILIITASIIIFTKSLKSNIRESSARENRPTANMRISADMNSGRLYLWGGNEGMAIRSTNKIAYHYTEGFYIIEMEDASMAYLLQVFDKSGLVASFRHFSDEEYPIYPE